jgi:hypothetical protein
MISAVKFVQDFKKCLTPLVGTFERPKRLGKVLMVRATVKYLIKDTLKGGKNLLTKDSLETDTLNLHAKDNLEIYKDLDKMAGLDVLYSDSPPTLSPISSERDYARTKWLIKFHSKLILLL